jgi:multidrug efflux pump subunit AcrA (membrane-fusion protein)
MLKQADIIAPFAGERRVRDVAGSPDPAAQGAEIAMYEVAAGVHSDTAIDKGLDVAGDRVVVDIRNMNIERHCTHML